MISSQAVNPIELNFQWPEALCTAAVCVYPAKAKAAINALQSLQTGDSENAHCVKVATGTDTENASIRIYEIFIQ